MGFSNADLGRVHPSNPSGAQPFLREGGQSISSQQLRCRSKKYVFEPSGRLIVVTSERLNFLLISDQTGWFIFRIFIPLADLEFALTPTDSQQPVAERPPWGARGLLLHAAPRLASLRDLLHAPPSLSRRPRRPRLHGLPQPAEPVQPRLPQQLLQRRLAPRAGRQRPPRLRGQARV